MWKDLLERFNPLGESTIGDVAFIVGAVFVVLLKFPFIVEYAHPIIGVCAIICLSWRWVKAQIWPDSES